MTSDLEGCNANVSRSRIVMLTHDRRIDRRILNEVGSLQSAGFDVTVVAMPADDGDTNDPAYVVRVTASGELASRESWVLSVYKRVRTRVAMNGLLMRTLKRVAWTWAVDPETFYDKLMWATAARLPADVYVAHDLPMLPLAARLAAEKRATLVYDSHELYSEQEFSVTERRRWQEVEGKYIARCDAVITINPSIAGELERRYDVSKVHVISNAERRDSFPAGKRCFHEKFHLSADSKVLLMQGGLTAGRHLDVLVAAMRYVTNPAVILVVMGEGALLRSLEGIVRTHRLSERVFFHDAVPQSMLIATSAGADAGIVPYQATCLNNLYCSPNKLYEFIAAGIPVLASDLPELRRIVAGGDIGVVADLRSEKAMAQAIDDFFADADRFALWRKNAAAIRSRISWEVESERLVALYKALP